MKIVRAKFREEINVLGSSVVVRQKIEKWEMETEKLFGSE